MIKCQIKYSKRLNKALKIENIMILIDANDTLSDYITLQSFTILMTCIIKDDSNFYPQTNLEESFYNE